MVDPRPLGMRIQRPYNTEEEFVRGDGPCMGRSGMILLGAPPRPPGVIVRFEVLLAGGVPVFRGEGRVVAHRVHPGGRKGLEIRFTRLDSHSKAIVEQALELRRLKLQTPGPPAETGADRTPPPNLASRTKEEEPSPATGMQEVGSVFTENALAEGQAEPAPDTRPQSRSASTAEPIVTQSACVEGSDSSQAATEVGRTGAPDHAGEHKPVCAQPAPASEAAREQDVEPASEAAREQDVEPASEEPACVQLEPSSAVADELADPVETNVQSEPDEGSQPSDRSPTQAACAAESLEKIESVDTVGAEAPPPVASESSAAVPTRVLSDPGGSPESTMGRAGVADESLACPSGLASAAEGGYSAGWQRRIDRDPTPLAPTVAFDPHAADEHVRAQLAEPPRTRQVGSLERLRLRKGSVQCPEGRDSLLERLRVRLKGS